MQSCILQGEQHTDPNALINLRFIRKDNPLKDDGVKAFLLLLELNNTWPNITEFNFRGTQCGNGIIPVLGRCMRRRQTVVKLSLSCTFSPFPSCVRLTVLSVDNSIDENGMKNLIPCLGKQACPNLQHLDLSDNPLGPRGVRQLALAMERDELSTITTLNLVCVGADTSAFTWIARALNLNVCQRLRTLNLKSKYWCRCGF